MINRKDANDRSIVGLNSVYRVVDVGIPHEYIVVETCAKEQDMLCVESHRHDAHGVFGIHSLLLPSNGVPEYDFLV